MALSAEDQARLETLRKAYDKLIAGTKAVSVATDFGTVTYGQGDIAALREEIKQLEAKNTTTGRTRGPVRFKVL